MNVARSLVDDIKTKQIQRYGHVQDWKRGDYQKKL